MEATVGRWVGMGPGISERAYRPGQQFQRLSVSGLSHDTEKASLGRRDPNDYKPGLSGSESLSGVSPFFNGRGCGRPAGKSQSSLLYRPSAIVGILSDPYLCDHQTEGCQVYPHERQRIDWER